MLTHLRLIRSPFQNVRNVVVPVADDRPGILHVLEVFPCYRLVRSPLVLVECLVTNTSCPVELLRVAVPREFRFTVHRWRLIQWNALDARLFLLGFLVGRPCTAEFVRCFEGCAVVFACGVECGLGGRESAFVQRQSFVIGWRIR